MEELLKTSRGCCCLKYAATQSHAPDAAETSRLSDRIAVSKSPQIEEIRGNRQPTKDWNDNLVWMWSVIISLLSTMTWEYAGLQCYTRSSPQFGHRGKSRPGQRFLTNSEGGKHLLYTAEIGKYIENHVRLMRLHQVAPRGLDELDTKAL